MGLVMFVVLRLMEIRSCSTKDVQMVDHGSLSTITFNKNIPCSFYLYVTGLFIPEFWISHHASFLVCQSGELWRERPGDEGSGNASQGSFHEM